MFWNCQSHKYDIKVSSPLGARNWGIGCVGLVRNGNGYWESWGEHVAVRSLYLSQLEDRLGSDAVRDTALPQQLEGTLWSVLEAWRGDGLLLGPLHAGYDQIIVLPDDTVELFGTVRNLTLLDNGAVITWSKASGPGAVTFADAHVLATTARIDFPGRYVVRLSVEDGQTLLSDDVTILVYLDETPPRPAVTGARFAPSDFDSLGSITGGTSPLTFDTDFLSVHGGLAGIGRLGLTSGRTEVAVFTFDAIDLTRSPLITGSRPLVVLSKSDFRIAATVKVNGGPGGHRNHGMAVAGGHDGGDSIRDQTQAGFTGVHGKGPGGSRGFTTGDGGTGGGGYGGAGGTASLSGGVVYGASRLPDLLGGSGAGASHNKGGGAGGGAIELAAAGDLVIVTNGAVQANGGKGAFSNSQITSGGGSGGTILLTGRTIAIDGTVQARGGNGGSAAGGQTNGGGGGGGRIAIFYSGALTAEAGALDVSGGIPEGGDGTGKPGGAGTVFTEHFPRRFLRGDSNSDSKLDVADPIYTLRYAFVGGEAPTCLDAADSNDDGSIDVADAIFALQYLFVEGPMILPPYPGCGIDPTIDDLDCSSYEPCEEQLKAPQD
jgi:hypothetical protein